MEASVVFSPTSYLPRSVMTNLTVHFMGQAINLLEASLWIFLIVGFFNPLPQVTLGILKHKAFSVLLLQFL